MICRRPRSPGRALSTASVALLPVMGLPHRLAWIGRQPDDILGVEFGDGVFNYQTALWPPFECASHPVTVGAAALVIVANVPARSAPRCLEDISCADAITKDIAHLRPAHSSNHGPLEWLAKSEAHGKVGEYVEMMGYFSSRWRIWDNRG
jgi:hypothetical protein